MLLLEHKGDKSHEICSLLTHQYIQNLQEIIAATSKCKSFIETL
jgi:hypothetical protein